MRSSHLELMPEGTDFLVNGPEDVGVQRLQLVLQLLPPSPGLAAPQEAPRLHPRPAQLHSLQPASGHHSAVRLHPAAQVPHRHGLPSICWHSVAGGTFSQMPCQRPGGMGGGASSPPLPASTAVTLSTSCSPKKVRRVRTCTTSPDRQCHLHHHARPAACEGGTPCCTQEQHALLHAKTARESLVFETIVLSDGRETRGAW